MSENEMINELAKRHGFTNAAEMNVMVSLVNISTPMRYTAFQHWKEVDGSKQGLIQVMNGEYLHYRYEAQPVVASEPAATVERMEDLVSTTLTSEMLVEDMLHISEGKIIFMTHRRELEVMGLVISDLAGRARLTERGEALVADYQRRHENRGAASLKDFDEGDTDNVFDDVLHLQAEVARLEAENAALKEAVDISDGLVNRLCHEQVTMKQQLAAALNISEFTPLTINELINAVRIQNQKGAPYMRKWIEDTLASK